MSYSNLFIKFLLVVGLFGCSLVQNSFDKKLDFCDESIKKSTHTLLCALEKSDVKRVKELIHPTDGITLSANTFFDKRSDLHFKREDFVTTFSSKKQLYWGEDETKGDPIKMSLHIYLKTLIGDLKDISKVKTLNEFKNFPQTDGIKGCEVYWIGEDNPEYNWGALVVLFKRYQDKWYVVGMLSDHWTP